MCVSGTRGLRAIYMCGTMHSPKCCTNPWLTCSFSRGFPYGQLMRPLTKLITILPYEPNSSSSYKVACNSFFKNHKFIIVKKKKNKYVSCCLSFFPWNDFCFFFPLYRIHDSLSIHTVNFLGFWVLIILISERP